MCACSSSKIQNNKTAGWKMVWSDEFNYTGLPDSTKWAYDADEANFNNEMQYYTYKRPENVYVEKGILTINAHKEIYKESDYTSARLVTRGKKDILYGKIDVRAKLPKGRGTWPAIWLLSSKQPRVWPDDGEIDIMEHVGYNEGVITGAVHVKRRTTGTDIISTVDTILVEQATEAFHEYSLIWTPTRLEWLIDGKMFHHYDKADRPSHHWPFDKAFYLILNIAIGGSWGGKYGVDDSIFPQKMEVDYVRISTKAL